jgi:hypothetical protein
VCAGPSGAGRVAKRTGRVAWLGAACDLMLFEGAAPRRWIAHLSPALVERDLPKHPCSGRTGSLYSRPPPGHAIFSPGSSSAPPVGSAPRPARSFSCIRRSHTFFRFPASRLALATRFFAIARARDLFSGVQFSTASWVCAAACAQLQLLGEPRPVARLAPTLAMKWTGRFQHANAWAGFLTNRLINNMLAKSTCSF